MQGVDVRALARALDARRRELGLGWSALAREIWAQSAELNQRRGDHPLSPATLSGIERRGDVSCQHALFVLRFLGRSPEDYVPGHPPGVSLPACGPDRRLRWNLRRTYDALDEERRRRGLCWSEVAEQIGGTTHQLRGLRTARFGASFDLVVRCAVWSQRPCADFVDVAQW